MNNNDNWDEHWSQQDLLSNYNPGQILRHELIINTLCNLKNFNSLIDFGSGQGDLLLKVSKAFPGLKLIGIEYSQVGVDISKSSNPNAFFYKADLMDVDLQNVIHLNSDVIVCCDVLEHVDKPLDVLRNAYEILTPGGVMLITLPGGPMTKLDYHIGHRFHYDENSLKRLLLESKFETFEVKSVGWPFFNLYRLMLMVRGSKLIDDVSHAGSHNIPLHIKVIGIMFKILFKLNINRFNLGWQMFAIVRKHK